MRTEPVATCTYVYGAGDEANRQVEFFRDETSHSIEAQIFLLNMQDRGACISILSGAQIDVRFKNIHDVLTNLSIKDQNKVFQKLPHCSIIPYNIFGNLPGPGHHERVYRLAIWPKLDKDV